MLNRLQDVFKFFQKHEVKYLVIGGVASGREVDMEDIRLLQLPDQDETTS